MSTIAQQRWKGSSFLARMAATGQPSTAVAAVMFTILMISFRPFQPSGAQLTGDGGDIVNQLGFGALGGIAVASLLTLVDRRVLASLLSPWWMVLMVFLAIATFNTPVPGDTMRTVAFSIIGILTIAAILTLPRDADAFSRVLVFAGFIILGLSYFGVIALRDVAVHQVYDVESQHAGLWRGVFTHKNIAGPVMAGLAFAGLYLCRRGWRWTGGLMALLAMVFVFHTGSKTTTATVPLAGMLVALPGIFGLRALVPVFVVGAVSVLALATLGIVFIDPLKDLAATLAPDLTYTGRTPVWEFAGDMIMQKPWFGYGFDNFWLTQTVFTSDQSFDRLWDIRGIVHGHNGYIDIALGMGLPALAIAIITFLFMPLRDYMRTPLNRENVFLADFFMMVVTFCLFNAFLESFFFRRIDPVWMLFVMGVFGMRLVARFRVPGRAER
ncbi:O-antigen ligase family protein [Nitratireductor kimnyeongensis]|uniref:O-antigen ligase family protein n=1 Tax=Nitratireductor kimnyeongensis TaxID=430679 RepID=A0ABW0T6J6_9HYPH|nr:O-antigen ligase [Nitratireductor kimnyeongensis]QZZ34073.1 O-antigen ligase family protein [Nitratireductor kimnyeongensis]